MSPTKSAPKSPTSLKSGQPSGVPPLRLFTDSALAPIVKSFTKKFPSLDDVAKAGSAYQAFINIRREIRQELVSTYKILAFFRNWVDATAGILRLTAENLDIMGLDVNPDISFSFLELSALLILCLWVVAKMNVSKKAVVAAFAKVDMLNSGVVDPDYKRLSEIILQLDKPYQGIMDSEMFFGVPWAQAVLSLLGDLAGTQTSLATGEEGSVAQSGVTPKTGTGEASTASSTLTMEMARGSLAPVDVLRKSGVLTLIGMGTSQNTHFKVPAVGADDIRYKILSRHSLMCDMIMLNSFPLAAYISRDKTQSITTLMKMTVGYGVSSPRLTMPEVFPAQTELEAYLKSNSKFSKLKSAIGEAVQSQVQNGALFHRHRREFFRHQLSQLYALGTNQPIVLASKLPMVLACLGAARDELVHYFTKHEAAMQSGGKKQAKGPAINPYTDLSVFVLLQTCVQLRQLLLEQKLVVQEFYLDYIKTKYVTDIVEQLETLLGIDDSFFSDQKARSDLNVRPVFEAVQKAVSALDEVTPTEHIERLDFFRQSWTRLQLVCSITGTPVALTAFKVLSRALNELSWRTSFVDKLADIVREAGSFADLYYYRDLISMHLEEALNNAPASPAVIKSLGCVAPLACDFLTAAHPWLAEEADTVQRQVIDWVCLSFEQIGGRAAQYLDYYARIYAQLEKELLPEVGNANLRHAKDKKLHAVIPGNMPGSESSLQQDTSRAAAGMYGAKSTVCHLLFPLQDNVKVMIGSTTIYPLEYFYQAVQERATHFMQGNVLDDAPTSPKGSEVLPGDDTSFTIKRPSVLLSELEAYISACLIVREYGDTEMGPLLAGVLRQQTDLFRHVEICVLHVCRDFAQVLPEPTAGQRSSSPSKKDRRKPPPSNAPYAAMVSIWYIELAINRSLQNNCLLSLLRRTMVGNWSAANSAAGSSSPVNSSNVQQYFRPEDFTCRREHIALCSLIGPGGLRFLDEQLCKYITVLSSSFANLFIHMTDTIKQFQQLLDEQSKFCDLVKKCKSGLDEIFDRLVSIGYLVDYRELLYDALETSLGQRNAGLLNCAQALLTLDEADRIDTASELMGLREYNDALLCSSFDFTKNLNLHVNTWALLSPLYTMLFIHMCFSENHTYQPLLDANASNAQCLAASFHAICKYVVGGNMGGDSAIDEFCERTIERTSVILLRLSLWINQPENKELKLKDVDTALHTLSLCGKGRTSQLPHQDEVHPVSRTRMLHRYMDGALLRAIDNDLVRSAGTYRRRRNATSRGNLLDDEAE
ncbi:Nck-associated protein 1 [Sorochytrium milnesiophthora]